MKKSYISTIVLLLMISANYVKASSTIAASFTGHSLAVGQKLWFTSVVKIAGTATYPLAVYFTNQSITVNGSTVVVPNGELILDATVTTATTVFNGTSWITTAPPNASGNYFISGVCDSLTTSIPSGNNPVSWTGTFSATRSGVTVNWQWSAADYNSFSANLASLGVKSSDCTSCSAYSNSDAAGSPENYKAYLTNGADSHGNGDYAGSVNATLGVTPVLANFNTSFCSGTTLQLQPVSASGTWKSSNAAVATISNTGLVTGVAGGIVTITNSSTTFTTTLTINQTPATGPLTGTSNICTGITTLLTPPGPGGVWTSNNASVATVSTSGLVTGLAAGAATISYSLSNVCGSSSSTQVVTINQSAIINGSVSNVTCNGWANGDIYLGSIVIDVNSPSGIYTCLWSNGSTSAYGAYGLSAGNYSLTVTESNGCATTQAYTITQPQPITAVASVTNSTGTSGAINFVVSGGTAPYSYSWSNGTTTESLSGLTVGDYCVAVSDANSCSFNDCYYVNALNAGRIANGGTDSTNTNALPTVTQAEAHAYPNPFTSTTNVTFTMPVDGHTTVDVYNAVNGQKITTVFNDDTKAGTEYTCLIDGSNLPSGLYIYKISSENTTYVGKVTLVK